MGSPSVPHKWHRIGKILNNGPMEKGVVPLGAIWGSICLWRVWTTKLDATPAEMCEWGLWRSMSGPGPPVF